MQRALSAPPPYTHPRFATPIPPTPCPALAPCALLQAARAVFAFTFPHHFDLTAAAAPPPQPPPSAAAAAAAPPAQVAAGALGVHCFGDFSPDQLFDGMELCRLGCERVAAFARLSLAKSLQQSVGL